MPAFVLQFGYESPAERAANERDGADFESSEWVVINAPDEGSALA